MDKELIILGIYINVDGKSRQWTEQYLDDFKKYHEGYLENDSKNIKMIIIPTQGETKVECIYPPHPIILSDKSIEDLLLDIYRFFLNHMDEEAKELIKEIERKLKFKKINDKLQ